MMGMWCVLIVRLKSTVGLLALPISKNNIEQVKPVKKFKQSEIRIRKRRIQTCSATLPSEKLLLFLSWSAFQHQFRATIWHQNKLENTEVDTIIKDGGELKWKWADRQQILDTLNKCLWRGSQPFKFTVKRSYWVQGERLWDSLGNCHCGPDMVVILTI